MLKTEWLKELFLMVKNIYSDIVLSGADYHHTETLLAKEIQTVFRNILGKKNFCTFILLFYVGFDKKLKNVDHHTLFFDIDFDTHAEDIYDNPEWPEDPLFYASFPSITDNTAAPEGKEAGIFLIPLAPGLEDTQKLREKYFEKIIDRFEKLTYQKVKNNIIFKESFV